jgi:hypothetical protein
VRKRKGRGRVTGGAHVKTEEVQKAAAEKSQKQKTP